MRYSITTRRLRICCSHPEWLEKTQKFYNEIEYFYYNLLLIHRELWNLSSQQSLRELELLSIPGRDGRLPETPIPWKKVPLYFRRSAANAGIAAAKSRLARNEAATGRKAAGLNSAVVYYKGMYRDFSSSEITLKVYNGENWGWMRCRLYGQAFPEGAQILSPSVVFEYKYIMLHVPIKEYGEKVLTVKQRMQDNRNICAIRFTNGDAFAVGCVLDSRGMELGVKFWGGGDEYRHRCSEILKKIEKSCKSSGAAQTGPVNQKYWMHLKHLADFHAHQVSSEIVKFCQEQEAALIVFPKYKEEFSRHVMKGAGDWGPLHLSRRIREYTDYKAWRAGILTIEVHAGTIGTVCAKCRGSLKEIDKSTDTYRCENGHQGNRHLNAARNLGRKCLVQFGKNVE